MKTLYRTTILVSLLAAFTGYAQENTFALREVNNSGQEVTVVKKEGKQKIVVITGNRFSYPLIQQWIDDYNKVKSDVQIVIESRGTNDPSKYDILSEVYEQEDDVNKTRDYLHIARYVVLPVANSKSAFAKLYTEKGVNQELINQLFFHDIYADKKKEQDIKAPFTIYTRLQKAGIPIVFTKYFGFQQKDIKGKAIAGSDEHLLKTILRDTIGVSYLPLTLIYDHATKKTLTGLTVLPVDLNGNGRVSDDEKFYGDLATVIQRFEEKDVNDFKNLPTGYLHLSIEKNSANPDAVDFLNWVRENGQNYLHDFGYLKPEAGRFDDEKFEQASSKRSKS